MNKGYSYSLIFLYGKSLSKSHGYQSSFVWYEEYHEMLVIFYKPSTKISAEP